MSASYQVIARKYRPQRFEDVVGQDHVTQTLSNAIRQDRIAHAYLFVGPRGTGKTTLARIFAKCLNATDGPRVDFPEDDARCLEIAEGRCLDVLEIDGASNRGIDEIRELRETVNYAPSSCRYKVYIIDEVHMLTKEAFNALLKTLEEPPPHVKFMFATTEPEKVLPTILSRCQRFDLRRIPIPLIVKHLDHICGLEKVNIEPAALQAIARGADGGMRDAESTLDQLISFCGDKIVESDVLSMFGLSARSQIRDLSGAILQGDLNGALVLLKELVDGGKELGRLLSDLLEHFRNLFILNTAQNAQSMLEVPEDELKTLKNQAASIEPTALSQIMEALSDAESGFRNAVSKRIYFEVQLMKAIEARNAVPLDEVLKKLNQLKAGAPKRPAPGSGRSVSPAAPPAAPNPPAPDPAPGPPPSANQTVAPPDSRESLLQVWRQILEEVGKVSQFTRSYLLEAHPVSLTPNLFTIGFDPEYSEHLGLVDNSKNHELISNKLGELGHGRPRVKFIESPAPARSHAPKSQAPTTEPASSANLPRKKKTPAPSKPDAAPSGPEAVDLEQFKQDPQIREALEIFKGQIVDVRN